MLVLRLVVMLRRYLIVVVYCKYDFGYTIIGCRFTALAFQLLGLI